MYWSSALHNSFQLSHEVWFVAAWLVIRILCFNHVVHNQPNMRRESTGPRQSSSIHRSLRKGIPMEIPACPTTAACTASRAFQLAAAATTQQLPALPIRVLSSPFPASCQRCSCGHMGCRCCCSFSPRLSTGLVQQLRMQVHISGLCMTGSWRAWASSLPGRSSLYRRTWRHASIRLFFLPIHTRVGLALQKARSRQKLQSFYQRYWDFDQAELGSLLDFL